jgi:hypothetical protein
MYIDFKITTWERVEIPPEREKEVLTKLKSGEIECSNDLWSMDMNMDLTYETLDDTSVQMTPKENLSSPTIEVFKERGSDPLWDNWIKK